MRHIGIHFEYFPVRCAFVLSVLDNAFFAAFKNNISHFEDSDTEKEEKIRNVFIDMLKRRIPEAFFKHCKYNSIFDRQNMI